jgi:hypothetical protein
MGIKMNFRGHMTVSIAFIMAPVILGFAFAASLGNTNIIYLGFIAGLCATAVAENEARYHTGKSE